MLKMSTCFKRRKCGVGQAYHAIGHSPPCPLSAPLTSTQSHHACRWQNKSCWRESSFHLCSPPTLSFSPTFSRHSLNHLAFSFTSFLETCMREHPRAIHAKRWQDSLLGQSADTPMGRSWHFAFSSLHLFLREVNPHSKSKIQVFS